MKEELIDYLVFWNSEPSFNIQYSQWDEHSLPFTNWGSYYQHALTLIPACINNHTPSKVLDEITYPFPNFNGCTIEVWEMDNWFHPKVNNGCNYLSILGLKLIRASNPEFNWSDLSCIVRPAGKHTWAPWWAWWAWWARACHSETNVGPTWAKHWEFRRQSLYDLYGAHNWLTMGITWAKTMGMPYKNFVLPMCGETMVLFRQFHGPTNVCPT